MDKFNGVYSLYSDSTSVNIVDRKKINESIEKNGGFYIGRYEANIDGKKIRSVAGVYPAINVDFDTASLYASKMYKDSKSVQSILPTGNMWDAVLQVLMCSATISNEDILSDSKAYGNYSNTETLNKDEDSNNIKLEKTGDNYYHQLFEIYDMAGNVAEWTSETYNTLPGVVRGGSYEAKSSEKPISNRDALVDIKTRSEALGFRVALFIK